MSSINLSQAAANPQTALRLSVHVNGGLALSVSRQRIHQLRHPEQLAANQRLHYATKHGHVTPQPCERCGAQDAHAHHDDYKKPFAVRWLCPKCHAQRHVEIRLARAKFLGLSLARCPRCGHEWHPLKLWMKETIQCYQCRKRIRLHESPAKAKSIQLRQAWVECGTLLRAQRKQAGMTIRQLALTLGLGQAAGNSRLSAIEHGRCGVSLKSWQQITAIIGDPYSSREANHAIPAEPVESNPAESNSRILPLVRKSLRQDDPGVSVKELRSMGLSPRAQPEAQGRRPGGLLEIEGPQEVTFATREYQPATAMSTGGPR